MVCMHRTTRCGDLTVGSDLQLACPLLCVNLYKSFGGGWYVKSVAIINFCDLCNFKGGGGGGGGS